jgi:proteic killer suppression protein
MPIMDIRFTNSKLEKLCNSESKLRGQYGPAMARKIQQRLGELTAAVTLESMRGMPGNCHELKQNLKGLWAISLIGKERLAFKPDHEPPPEMDSGGLDWSKVTKIEVVGIGDYH